MKKKNDFVRVTSSIVLGCLLAIILLFAPNVRALQIPSGQEEPTVINDDIGWDMLEIYGTAILEGDAAALLIYAYPGKELNEPGSTVHIYGCAPSNYLGMINWLTVLEPTTATSTQSSTQLNNGWYGQDSVVNIYGSRFRLDSNPSFAPPVVTPIPDNVLSVLNDNDEVQFSIRISSNVPIHLQALENEDPERVEAELNVSPSVMNLNRKYPVVFGMIRLPEGIKKDDIDKDYPLMIYTVENDYGVEATKYKRILQPSRNKSAQVKICAFFNIGPLLQNLPDDCEEMHLEVRGRLISDQEFYGQDKIKLVKPRRKHWTYMKNWKRQNRHR
jgi:hypothetical protein